MTDDVRWNLVGGDVIDGRDDVIAQCDESASFIATVKTTFTSFRVLAGPDHVTIESTADYVEDGDLSQVASCDVYRFVGGRLDEIASYNLEVTEGDDEH